MFESGKTVRDLKDIIADSVDVAGAVPDSRIFDWVNEVQQTLYSEFVREYAEYEGDVDAFPVAIPGTEETDAPRFGDIHRVYVDGVEYTRATLASVFPMTYFERAGKLDVSEDIQTPAYIRVIYFARPALAASTTDPVRLPPEWFKLIVAYCKAMAYKEYNEFAVYNNYLAEYNAHLADFAVWVEKRRPAFGR